MSSNALDELLTSVRKTLDNVGVGFNLLTIGVTLSALVFPFFLFYIFALSQRDDPIPPPLGCRKIGLPGNSNLSDQYSKKYSKGGERSNANIWTVKALFVYPIKSCAGIEVEQSEIIRTGLKYDR